MDELKEHLVNAVRLGFWRRTRPCGCRVRRRVPRRVDVPRGGALAGGRRTPSSAGRRPGIGLIWGWQDATNLAWKLALPRAAGAAPQPGLKAERMVDSYTRERLPVAKDVVDNVLAQLSLMLSDKPHEVALRSVVEEGTDAPRVQRSAGHVASPDLTSSVRHT